MTRTPRTRGTPRAAAIVLATTAALALGACGGTDDTADAPAATGASADTGNGSGDSGPGADTDDSAGSGDDTAASAPGSSDASADAPSGAVTVTGSVSGPVSVPASGSTVTSADASAVTVSPSNPTSGPVSEPATASPTSGTDSGGPAVSASGSVPATQTLVGDTAPIEPIPCDGANYLGEITPMTVQEAMDKIDQLRSAYPDANFGHFTQPCGPEDQLVIYWGEPSDRTKPLLDQRRLLERPRVVVLQLDPQRPGYLDTGLCALDGDGPVLQAGDTLDRRDKNWLFELTSYLGAHGLIHPDHAGVTEIDQMVDTGIRSFQERNGLETDGVVRAATWDALSGKVCQGGAPELHPIEQ